MVRLPAINALAAVPEYVEMFAEAFPDEVDERPIRVRDYLRSTKACKLHDFETGQPEDEDGGDHGGSVHHHVHAVEGEGHRLTVQGRRRGETHYVGSGEQARNNMVGQHGSQVGIVVASLMWLMAFSASMRSAIL